MTIWPMTIWRFDYTPHRRFVAPAGPKSELWRLAFGVVLLAAFFLALSQMLVGFVLSMTGGGAPLHVEDAALGQSAGEVLLVLVQLGLLGVSAGLVCIVLHGRAPKTLFGDMPLALRQFGAVGFVLLILIVVLWILPPYDYGAPLERNMAFGAWALLLPLAIPAVLLQVSGEELIFRGYLQQQLGARFASPVVWMLVPAVLFGALHYAPASAGSNAMMIALHAVLFGVITADLTARSGTLGPAIALHFANNAQALLLTSVPDEMSGLALYVLPFGMADEAQIAQWLPVDIGWMLVAWLGARLALKA